MDIYTLSQHQITNTYNAFSPNREGQKTASRNTFKNMATGGEDEARDEVGTVNGFILTPAVKNNDKSTSGNQ